MNCPQACLGNLRRHNNVSCFTPHVTICLSMVSRNVFNTCSLLHRVPWGLRVSEKMFFCFYGIWVRLEMKTGLSCETKSSVEKRHFDLFLGKRSVMCVSGQRSRCYSCYWTPRKLDLGKHRLVCARRLSVTVRWLKSWGVLCKWDLDSEVTTGVSGPTDCVD